MKTQTQARAALRELSSALKVVHRRLLMAVQRHFEKLHGRVGPGAALQLAVKDPLFTWLDPLTRQIAAVDELLAGEADVEAVEAAHVAVSKLFDEDAAFRASYHVYLQSEPDVVVAHATLRRLLPPSR